MMAKKKPDWHWRQGVRVSHEGQRDEPATEKMALHYLRLAALERDPDREIQLLKQAKTVGILGRINERKVDLNTFRPGRRKGSTYEQIDAPAYDFMAKAAAAIGEDRPHTLARLAVKAGHVKITNTQTAAAAIKRLAAGWKRRVQKN